MGLNLKELVELAMLDAVMDKPITLDGLLGAGAPWHELSGRADVKGMMGPTLHHLLDSGVFTVAELHDGQASAALTGGEAAMLFERASANSALMAGVQVQITDSGRAHYKTLAHRYYNG